MQNPDICQQNGHLARESDQLPEKYCIIVDAYSSGSLIAPEFIKLGLTCIHVQSRKDIKMVASTLREMDFSVSFLYDGDLDKLILKLREFKPLFVMPGFHTGVYLADILGTRLGIPSNNECTTKFRMDKFLMHQTLAKYGIDHAKSFLVGNREELLNRFYHDFEERPVMVKPSNSAGTDMVFYCKSQDDVSNAFKNIHNKTNAMDITNEKILIQEYLEGDEYIVNTVSFNGYHITTDIWRSYKNIINDRTFFYDRAELLESVGNIQQRLCEYNSKVLEALGFTFGACHNELIMTSRGPVLVEMNPRLSGGHLPDIALVCTGMGQVGWVRKLAEQLLNQVALKPVNYQLHKKSYVVTLISYVSGTLKRFENLDRIESLQSFYSMDMRVNVGENIKRTVDVWTGPGLVVLTHDDPQIVHEDFIKVREIEKEGLYIL